MVRAEKAARAAGVDLDDEQVQKAGTALHYALAMSWAPAYIVLRRMTRLAPWGAGLAAGMSMYALVDEALNPVLGFTPPPKAYPFATHLRGLAGHLVFGLAVAAVTEAGWKLLGNQPRPS